MKKRRYQIAALMMSVIIATGSLSGSVFAAETSGETAESSVVEVIEETDESETADEGAGEGSENESEQETDEPAEDTFQETEGSVEDTQDLDEKEEDHDQSVPEDTENNTEEEKTDSSADTADTPKEETAVKKETSTKEDRAVTTIPAEQEIVITDSMYSEQETDENVVDSGKCGSFATWKLTGTDNNLTLTFSGRGEIDDCSETSRPWDSRRLEIKHAVVDGNISSVGAYVFYSLKKLEDVSLSESVSSIGQAAFSGCSNLEEISLPKNLGYLFDSAFSGCSSLKSITVPDNVYMISSGAFSGCSNLEEISLPKNLEYIYNSAFSGCSSLKNIMIPDRVTDIGKSAFYGCSSLNSITLPNGVKTIKEKTFQGCSNLTSITLPNKLESIGISAFSGCSNMEDLVIPEKVYWIDKYAFNECSSLKNITLPNKISTIVDSTFAKCSSLVSITLPTSITSIENYAFYGCSSLEEISIPDFVKSIGHEAFYGCSSLKHITIPDLVTTLGYAVFYNCDSLEKVTIPDSVTLIGGDVFYNCKSLQYIIIPNSVKSIGRRAFGESDTPTSVYFRGTKTEWAAAAPNEVFYKSIVYEYFSVDATVKLSKTFFSYAAKEICPTVEVTYNDQLLVEGIDYKLEYQNNTNAGIASVYINGIGDYSGTIPAQFTIARIEQSFNVKTGASTIDVGKTTKVTASGAKEAPKFTFTSSNTKIATVNTAGTVTGKAAGTVTITVKAAATTNYKELSKTVKITVNKVLKKPGNCHFSKWNNSKYTGCRISWNKVDGAEGYQTLLSWTDGSHSSATIVKSNVLYRDCTVHPQHVSQMKVRAFYTLNGQRKYGPWSNLEYITPSPAKLTTKNASSGSNLKMNISWNIIYGCNGYNVFITTNPNGKWYWNQSTTEKATATSASIDKCGGAKLKKNTRYYVRIVTRRKRNGVFCTVPMPANNTYIGSFVIK